MSADIIRTILLPVLLLAVIVALSLYFYKEGFANERDPTCPVGFYNSKGVLCSGLNKNIDSTGDLPSSFSGAPDSTCAQGSGRSKKTGGICTGANPDYNYADATATSNLFGNAGGSIMPTSTDSSGVSESDLIYDPTLDSPLFAASEDDIYDIFKFTSDSSGNSTAAKALKNILAAAASAPSTSASPSAPASSPSASAPSASRSKETPTDDKIVGHLAGGQGCPVEEECCEVDCDSISIKHGRALKKNPSKPYVATNRVPCWGC